jgi:uncharacterized membrane protein
MNKQDFLRKLKEDLSSFTDEELQNALKYYDEYFADAHEEEVEQEIEDYNVLEDLAEEIKAVEPVKQEEALQENYTYANADKAAEKIIDKTENYRKYDYSKEYKPKKRKSGMMIVLLICFSPILIPLVIAAASVVFSLFMALMSLALGFGCAAIGGLIAAGGGVFSVGYGIIQLITFNISEGLYAISVGLVGTGIGIILAYLFGKLTFIIFKYEFKFLGFLGRKIFKPARHGA